MNSADDMWNLHIRQHKWMYKKDLLHGPYFGSGFIYYYHKQFVTLLHIFNNKKSYDITFDSLIEIICLENNINQWGWYIKRPDWFRESRSIMKIKVEGDRGITSKRQATKDANLDTRQYHQVTPK